MSKPNRLGSVKKEALSLPGIERADLDGPADIDAALAWDMELCRRINEIEAGTASLLDADNVLARVRKRASGN